MKDSLAIRKEIKRREGIAGSNGKPSLTPYADTKKGFSIGWGHFEFGEKSNHPTQITEAKAQDYFDADIKQVEKIIRVNLNRGIKLTQNQYDALIMLGFNAPKALKKAISHINNSRDTELAEVFQQWIYSDNKVNPELVSRRNYEWALFNNKKSISGLGDDSSTSGVGSLSELFDTDNPNKDMIRIGIVLVVIAIVGAVGFFVYRKVKKV